MEKLKVNPKDLRIVNGLNQIQFWERVGITQSGGSRYESGERRLPTSLAHILRLTYVEHLELKNITRDVVEVGLLLKNEQPELYNSLLNKLKSNK